MPYARRYYKKKKSYSRKRSLSRFNTYRHRSSKAQAYQISKLNRKINYVYKNTKPDVHYFDSNPQTIDYNFDSNHFFNSVRLGTVITSAVNGVVDTNLDSSDSKTLVEYIGDLSKGTDKFRYKNGCIYFSIYKSHLNSQNVEVSGFDGIVGVDVYVCQSKQGASSTTSSSFFGPQALLKYDMTDLLRPINSGVWQYYKVLKHKRVYINDDNVDSKTFKLKYNPIYKTISSVKTQEPTQQVPQGQDLISHGIYLMARIVWKSTDNTPNVRITYSFRQYFTTA